MIVVGRRERKAETERDEVVATTEWANQVPVYDLSC